MPGTFIVKPIEANLTHNTDLLGRMNPYCSVVVGNTRIKGQICKKGGKHPHWNDSITVPATGESKVLVELMDKDKITHDDHIGSFELDLNEVQSIGQISKWYPLTYKNKTAGEILLETVYQPEPGLGIVGGQNQYYGQETLTTSQPVLREEVLTTSQPGVIKEEVVTTTTTTVQPAVVEKEVLATNVSRHTDVSEGAHTWTEQRQIIEPHTFIKEVEVVETRPAMKEVEFMEPHKVMKDVQYTQAVPVRKQIEVMEPQVVSREVEVIEPRLVTKTIQVVENVPVKRQVETVEMRNIMQEVESFEPQTFHKQVEVTEYVPVKHQVEVSQPVTLKKAVEFVEPVITTQTITKEMHPAVVIDQKVTTEVGPASVLGISQEYGWMQNWSEISLAERQKLAGLQRWVGYETIFVGLNDQERLWEQLRLSKLNEEQWIQERKRLLAFNEQQRLAEQRKFYSQFSSSNQFSSSSQYKSSTVQQTGYTSKYNPSPNF